ncbi:anti-sigma factor [Ramlibacter pallidus]|uniref:Anti-sigma factor n=1 Tax=Ramlibacter pallidus TaxID=2780087 RepID=A0ABR9RXK1_9BURK|nr:anti-sigma factor [Ramlibacter pallidus]MBE7365979.1 anti-sigma factor [Ramlibacter pallidus]
MNIFDSPELMDRLAASYALGTLRGGARRRFEALARRNPGLRARALVWQERFMSMTELQPAEAPSPNVWKRIANEVAAEPRTAMQPAPEPAGSELLRRARNWWRAGALAAVAASLAVVAVTLNLRNELDVSRTQLAQLRQQGVQLASQNRELVAQLQAQPEVRYVSVLHDDKATPTMLALFDPKHGTLTLKRMVNFAEGPEKSLQLWAVPATGGAPRSLGVLAEQDVLRLPAQPQVVAQSPLFAITLEAKGGVPEGTPAQGPILWKGAVLQTPL